MKFEFGGHFESVALLFPGQGSQNLRAIDRLKDEPEFARRYDIVCRLLERDVLHEARADPAVLRQNSASSLLTVLASSLVIDAFRRETGSVSCVGVAGYSVGQWSALYAAGMVAAEQLLAIVHARASIMDKSISQKKTGMLAVIGVKENDLREICGRARDQGTTLELTNINAPANYSLSGTENGLTFAETELLRLKPKVLVRLPVSGGWHSTLLVTAVAPFRDYLDKATFDPPVTPVVENTTGWWLPSERTEFVECLSQHLAKPVLWRQSIDTLLAAGTKTFVELGLGDMLTKFGAFITRKARHVAVLPDKAG